MGIEVKIEDTIKQRFDDFLNEVGKMQIELLQELGELCATQARNIPPELGFTDQTGNLRSSMGYMVFVDGVAIHTAYEAVKGASKGVKEGEELAKKIGSKQSGLCLVVTAGMNYALYVEAKGRDVLTSAEQLAERELPRMVEQLIKDIERATR